MPWICNQCGTEAVDTVVRCPECELIKSSWTLNVEVTRAFTIKRPGLRCLRAKPDREGVLTVRLEIDPEAPVSADDVFVLSSPDGDFAAQVRTVADDTAEGDAFTDLRFEGLDRSLRYTLEVDPGAQGEPYAVIDNRPFGELVGAPVDACPAPNWEATEAALVSDKGTVQDLARRGASPSPSRLLRIVGAGGKPVTVSVLYTTREVVDHEFSGEEDLHLLCLFGPGEAQGATFPGVQVLDVSENTPLGWAPRLEVSRGGKRTQEVELEGPTGGRLYLRLDVDANDPEAADDRFYLSSPRGAFATQVKTIREDLTPDDACTDLLFLGLDEEASYTLSVDPGGRGEPYDVFRDTPYSELVQSSAQPVGEA